MPLDQVQQHKFQIMPSMTEEQYQSLKDDIRANGVLDPIDFDQDGCIIDGTHRFEIWSDLIEEGVDMDMFPRRDLTFATEFDRLAYSLSKNLQRRHMTPAQRQELAIKLRKPPYSWTMQRIAEQLRVSVKTIWYDLDYADDATKAELAELNSVVGVDGKVYPTTKMQVSVPVYVSAEKSERQLNAGVQGALAVEGDTKREQLQEKWRVQPNQLWVIPSKSASGASHRVMCGDATDWQSCVSVLFDGHSASMLWTDPPYGVKYVGKTQDALTLESDNEEGLEQLLKQAFTHAMLAVAESSPFYICHPPGPISWIFGDVLRALNWRMHETLVWVKDSMVLGHSDYHLKHEPIYYGWLPGAVGRPGRGSGADSKWYGNDAQVSVFEVPRPKRSDTHPTMKPTELIVKHILNSSAYGAVIYDPFWGSGSTACAAEQVGRVCYAVEIDPESVAVGLDRLSLMGLEPRLVDRPYAD